MLSDTVSKDVKGLEMFVAPLSLLKQTITMARLNPFLEMHLIGTSLFLGGIVSEEKVNPTLTDPIQYVDKKLTGRFLPKLFGSRQRVRLSALVDFPRHDDPLINFSLPEPRF